MPVRSHRRNGLVAAVIVATIAAALGAGLVSGPRHVDRLVTGPERHRSTDSTKGPEDGSGPRDSADRPTTTLLTPPSPVTITVLPAGLPLSTAPRTTIPKAKLHARGTSGAASGSGQPAGTLFGGSGALSTATVGGNRPTGAFIAAGSSQASLPEPPAVPGAADPTTSDPTPSTNPSPSVSPSPSAATGSEPDAAVAGRPAGPLSPIAPVQPAPPPAPAPLTSTTTTPPAPDPPPPPRDVENCPNLGLVAIGDATDAPPEVVAASERFRALADAELESDALVCAHPMQRWRDELVIQRLVTNGGQDGALVAGLGKSDPVLRLSQVEWVSFLQFRDAGLSNHNFLGIPQGRRSFGAVTVITTTRGGLVMERPDSFGYGVVNGAWDRWMAHGGPAGDMGVPTSKPYGSIDEGARQDFTNGYVSVSGVTSDLDAEAQPPSRYLWQPVPEADRRADLPPVHSIVDIDGTSYYVDDGGVRHWIATGPDYGCARRQGAVAYMPRGYVAALYPLGSVFSCPS